ncbi:exodeoxyribonuclease VII small subunit [Derxia lacustris]|uniref:exodeoxyribonuclease VII small subunit n=1 Tax=Derxia lacustris TaxID=764842 RepID=UPI000A173179|nr:exodeoxyribonuclease VII small subunit [Derxia lacustris]
MSTTPATAAESADPPSFETALAELERLVETMESQQLPLDASVTAYQRGAELVRVCQAQLAAARQRLEVVDPEDPLGAAQPLDLGREDA